MNPGLVLRFVLSAAVGAGVAVGGAVITSPPPIVSTAHAGSPISLSDGTSQVNFGLQPGAPKPVDPLPADATIQLTSFHAAASPGPGGQQTPWLNPGVPRVPPISQFDGGPLQGSNCLLASGAMLARLGFGIVTTGSQLRTLQDRQEGGTSLDDLETAVSRGWGVQFFKGGLSALQLRALIYGGAGAVVSGLYAEIPVDLRLSKGFTGGHAIYVDAFRPPGPDGPAAYYVLDPIGQPWNGYRGGWWPADIVERFALVHYSDGTIHAAWAFPGGKVPKNHPILPPGAYPTNQPGASGAPSGGPSGSPNPSASIVVTSDPMPAGNTPIGPDPPTGTPPPDVPKFPIVDILGNAYVVDPGTTDCASDPRPSGCPAGIVGVIDVSGLALGSAPPATGGIDLLYATEIAPGTYQFVFEPPPDTSAGLSYWGKDGALHEVAAESATVQGKAVDVATITVDPTEDISFVATASGDGVRLISEVGTVTVKG